MDRTIGAISRRMLTLTLRGLERDGLITRTLAGTRVRTAVYRNTAMGEELRAALEALARWSCANAQNLQSAREQYDRAHA